MRRGLYRVIFLCLIWVVMPIKVFGQQLNMDITYDGKTYKYLAEEVLISVNGNKIEEFAMPPVVLENRTLVPARAVFEALGSEVSWNSDTKEIYIIRDNDLITIQINNQVGNKNGVQFTMDVPPKIINDSTMIPVRAVSEAMECNVDWVEEERLVKINDKVKEEPIIVGGEDSKPKPTTPTTTPTTPSSTGSISLRSVNIPESIDSPQIFSINASKEIGKYEVIEVGEDRIAIDVYDAEIGITGTSKEVSTSSYVNKVRWAQNQTTPRYIARVVFDLNSKSEYNVRLSEDKKTIIVEFSKNIIRELEGKSVNNIDYISITGDSCPAIKLSYLSEPNSVVLDIPFSESRLFKDYPIDGLNNISKITTSMLDADTVRVILETTKGVEVDTEKDGDTIKVVVYKSTVENISYSDDTLVFAKGAMTLSSTDIKTKDNYLNKEYILTLPGDYEGVYGYGRMRIGSDKVSSIYLDNVSGNTTVTIHQDKVFATHIWEDGQNIYVELNDPREEYDFVVVIDAGHGGKDPGTEGNGIVEKELNLDILKRLKDLIDGDSRIKAYYTRTDDTYPENYYRAKVGNMAADLFISIHHNASISDKPSGTETLYAIHQGESGLTSKKAAEIIQGYVYKALETENRGIKERPDLIVLNQTEVPAVLIEGAFLSNVADAWKMDTDEYRQKEAEAIYKAILEIREKYN